MPGRRNEETDGSYITQEQAYRLGINAADLNPANAAIPIIDLDLDVERTIRDPGAADPARRALHPVGEKGHDAVLAVFVVPDNVVITTTVQLWRRLNDAAGQIPETWCLAYAVNTQGPTVVRAGNLIAGKYRVLITALSAGSVDLAVAQTV